jgi:cytochrome oxidase Cu insertion factor (SCO1/SenC/PrrC family)
MHRISLCIIILTLVVFATIITKVNAEKNLMEDFKSLEVGMAAPDFTLKNGDGVEYSLRDYLGKKNVVLAFYPKDFTGG